MRASPANRVVALAGRPNVGKSALFNRIAGRRVSIVHEESGVTRDRLMRDVTWGGVPFQLIDTGGIADPEGVADASMEGGIRKQAEAALADAACVILVTDVATGVVPLDRAVAQVLRRSERPVYVAANKADTATQDVLSAEFEALGFPVYPVSAVHNRGIDALLSDILETLPDVEPDDAAPPLRVAVVGRPNAGKSSYINRLLRSDRVLVSDVAGTTRDSVDIPFRVGSGDGARRYLLTDTAGMRKRSKVHSPVEQYSLMRAEHSIAHADVVVHVVDSTTGASAQDRKIANTVLQAQKGYVLLFNKWDQMEHTTQRRFLPEITHQLPFLKQVPVLFTSTTTGMNIRKSIDMIDRVAGQIDATLPTGILNRAVQHAVTRSSSPVIKGRKLKIYYAVQVGARPVSVDCFVNDPRGIPDAYRQYLVNQLRKHFELEGAPLVIRFRARRDKRT